MLLFPTMVQTAHNEPTVGIQFVPGLSRLGKNQLPMLQTVGKQVAFLVDGDPGGRKLAKDLLEVGIKPESVFRLSRPGRGDVELEDFIDAEILASAVNELARRHHNNAELVTARNFPRYGKWGHIEEVCASNGIDVFLKVDVAYAILDLVAAEPTRRLLDAHLSGQFAASIQDVRDHLKNAEDEQAGQPVST